MTRKHRREETERSNMANRTEEFEIKHIMKTFGVTASRVKEAIQTVGNSREKIEEYLRNKSTDD